MPEKVREQRGGTAEKHISWTFPLKMFSETKGATSFELRNGLRAQRDLDGPQADIHRKLNTCGYDRPRLSSVPLGNGPQRNRVSVNFSLTECSFVAHQTEPRLSSVKCVQDTPAQFRGHGNCGSSVCVAEQQSGSVREALRKEPDTSDWTETSKRGFNCTSNGYVGRNLNLLREVMLSTKDPNISHQQTSCQTGEKRVIQEQIQNVVVNLEEVLRGLKEIHLEMKEVVQQIDLLTADIDMGEEDPDGALSSRMETCLRESESSRSSHEVDDFKTPTRARNSCTKPPAYPIRDQSQQLGSTQEMKHESALVRRGQKPPPYPYTNTPGGVNNKAKGRKAPPYPFRRTLLSTIV